MSIKNYTAFSFDDFLQDDYFISSMKTPTPESSKYWVQFRKENKNVKNFDAARDYIKSINKYHYTLSLREVEEILRAIHQKKDQKHKRRLYYLSVCAVAASVALLVFFRFLENEETVHEPVKPDIASFSDLVRPNIKTGEIQLMLSDEQSVFFDQNETVISYDTIGITVNKETIVQNEDAIYNQLIVPLGKRSILKLADGTKVWVNSDSRLIYPVSFAQDLREIYVDGEVYLEVAEESQRPFVVKTKNIDIRVLGTKFNVAAYEADNEQKVVLVSGSVQINPKNIGENILLLPDQMYLSENGHDRVETVDTKKYTSWIDRIYYCENENMEIILQRLSRYYGVEIICDPSIAKEIFSGKLDLKDNVSDIFSGISFTLPISFEENDGKYLIYMKK